MKLGPLPVAGRSARLGRIFLCLLCWLPMATAFSATKPNVVVIMADDAGYGDFGFMSQFMGRPSGLSTPNLDQLAAQSVNFSNAYVPSSICAITRAGIMTGRHPDIFGHGFNALEDDKPYDG